MNCLVSFHLLHWQECCFLFSFSLWHALGIWFKLLLLLCLIIFLFPFCLVCATLFHPPPSVSSALHPCAHYIGSFTVLGGFSSLCYSADLFLVLSFTVWMDALFLNVYAPTTVWPASHSVISYVSARVCVCFGASPGGTCSWHWTPTPFPLRSSAPRRCGTSGRGYLSDLPCANHNYFSPHPPTVAAWTGKL